VARESAHASATRATDGGSCDGDAETGAGSPLVDGNDTTTILDSSAFFCAAPDAFVGGCTSAAARIAEEWNARATGGQTAERAGEAAACTDCNRDKEKSRRRSKSSTSLPEGWKIDFKGQ
jgi:hypothetical protein